MCPMPKQITAEAWNAFLQVDGPEEDIALLPISYDRAKLDHQIEFEENRGQLGWEASAFIECGSVQFSP